MRRLCSYGVAAMFVAGAAAAVAAELKSGLQVGDSVGFFEVVKCAGPDDGVKLGQQLCYR
ncbi:MAG TPA: hypothetical protein VMV10_23425 [Pirellulales bacterium]|nr:hypothetical protein [Pirellulales bacterium]